MPAAVGGLCSLSRDSWSHAAWTAKHSAAAPPSSTPRHASAAHSVAGCGGGCHAPEAARGAHSHHLGCMGGGQTACMDSDGMREVWFAEEL